MNTFQLTCFLAVAEYLNFTQAANHLHVTHPAVSQQIQSLEKEMNVKLFERSTRSVRLTEEGKAFLSDAQQIVTISEQAKKRFSSTASSENVTLLTLGCSSFSCMLFLSRIYGCFTLTTLICTRSFRSFHSSTFIKRWKMANLIL